MHVSHAKVQNIAYFECGTARAHLFYMYIYTYTYVHIYI